LIYTESHLCSIKIPLFTHKVSQCSIQFLLNYKILKCSIEVQHDTTVRDSLVAIATGYVLESPRIECWRGRDFKHQSRPSLRPTQAPATWVTGLFPGGKAVEAWPWPSTPIQQRS